MRVYIKKQMNESKNTTIHDILILLSLFLQPTTAYSRHPHPTPPKTPPATAE